jgi:hypothetical protein
MLVGQFDDFVFILQFSDLNGELKLSLSLGEDGQGDERRLCVGRPVV